MNRFLASAVVAVVLTSPLAQAKSFNPKASTCAELQQSLANNGSVALWFRGLIFGIGKHPYAVVTYASHPACDPNEQVEKMVVKTIDNKKCEVGFYCGMASTAAVD